MKKLTLPKSLVATLAAPALLALVVPPSQVLAQGQTETKIRLMADALRARDSGDLDTAKKNLEELLAIAPSDATVQRLLAGVNTSIAARASGVAEQAPAVATSSEPVEVSYPPKPAAAEASTPVQTPEEAALSQADALAKQENLRLKALVSDAKDKSGSARDLAKEGRFDEAAAVLDGAINSLPANNPATSETIDDLQAEKNGLLLEKAQYALKRGDTDGARAALDVYAQSTNDTKQVASVSHKIDKVEMNPPLQSIEKVNPQFIADRKEVAKLLAKAKSQYVASDIDGAQETYRVVESIDTDNTEAKAMLTRIAAEKAQSGALNRTKTRAQMLEEVTNAWQRPGVYVDRDRDTTIKPTTNALSQKLNNIIIPSVNFNGVELSRVINTLSVISGEYDKSEGTKGVNIVVVDPTQKNPTVSITLRDLSLRRILDLITESTAYQYEVQTDTIIVRPGGETSTLENAFFPVTRATVLRMTGVGSAAATPAASSDPFASPSAAPAGGGGGGGGESGALQAFLEQAGVKFSTTPGSSLVYDGSAIIVNQSTKNIERIRNILNRYNDVRQVEIEAKFMEVQEGALEELGVQWSATQNNRNNRSASTVGVNRNLAAIGVGGGSGASGSIVQQPFDVIQDVSTTTTTVIGGVNSGSSSSTSRTLLNSFQGGTSVIAPGVPLVPGAADLGATAGNLITATATLGSFDVTAIIRALSQKSGTDLLSSPKVTVLSGNPANIVVAQEFRYPQSYGETQSTVSSSNSGGSAISITAGTPQEFTTRNVGVELKVTPTVEEDDYSISLDLSPKVTEFEGFVEYGGQSVAIGGNTTVTVPSGFYQPIFSTREVTTRVTVWDGATLVMGGLTREEVKKVNDKVPLLGDIPVIGRLFRSKGEATSKRNLLIFVTANLVSPGGSLKKQSLKSIPQSSMFQNPTVVTPGSSESRVRGGNK